MESAKSKFPVSGIHKFGVYLSLVLLVVLSGCTQLTGVIVELSLEEGAAERAQWVRIQIFSQSGGSEVADSVALENDGLWRVCKGSELGAEQCAPASMGIGDPMSYSVLPMGNRIEGRFRVTAALYDASERPALGVDVPFSTLEAFVDFREGELRRLPLRFFDACLDHERTESGMTCWAGEIRGSCFESLALDSASEELAEPSCTGCERCGGTSCEPVAAGTACGCAGDECDGEGLCRSKSLVRQIASGIEHTCVSYWTGSSFPDNDRESLYCWGGDQFGATGHYPAVSEPTAVCVGSDCRGVGSVSTGGFLEGSPGGSLTCALSGRTIHCWGIFGSRGSVDMGKPAPARSIWRDVRVGGGHICALTDESELYCWGANGTSSEVRGQLGTGSGERFVEEPNPVAGNHRWEAFSTGRYHTCGITLGGKLYCWGRNFDGQLGTGDYRNSNVPRQVSIFDSNQSERRWRIVAAGGFQTCALDSEHRVWCWGGNGANNLGRGNVVSDSPRPERVDSDQRFGFVDCGRSHCCAITRGDGDLYCWGRNSNQQTGVVRDGLAGASVSRPTRVNAGGGWASINLGEQHSCGSRVDGSLFCWGDNERAQVGIPDAGLVPRPVRVCLPERG